MESGHLPQFTLIAGPNGAGKSTFAAEFLAPATLIFDGDKSWRQHFDQLSRDPLYGQFKTPYRSREALSEMGNSFQATIRDAITHRKDFAYHTNFHAAVDLEVVTSFRRVGYQINLLFFGLAQPTLAQQRVNLRAQSEDTHVQEPTIDQIKARYQQGLTNLTAHFATFDRVSLVDNSIKGTSLLSLPKLQMRVEKGVITFAEKNLPTWVRQHVPKGLLPESKPVVRRKKGPRL